MDCPRWEGPSWLSPDCESDGSMSKEPAREASSRWRFFERSLFQGSSSARLDFELLRWCTRLSSSALSASSACPAAREERYQQPRCSLMSLTCLIVTGKQLAERAAAWVSCYSHKPAGRLHGWACTCRWRWSPVCWLSCAACHCPEPQLRT